MIDSEEYFGDVKIDPYQLHVNLADNPVLVLKWGKILANLKKTKANMVIDLDVYKAKLRMDIVTNPADYKLADKPTVSVIDSVIMMDAETITESKKLNDLQNEIDNLTFVQKSFDFRKTALNDLVKLWLKAYGTDLFADEELKKLMDTPEIMDAIAKINKSFTIYAKTIKFEGGTNPLAADSAREEQTKALNKSRKSQSQKQSIAESKTKTTRRRRR
jgi:hypothetical protein